MDHAGAHPGPNRQVNGRAHRFGHPQALNNGWGQPAQWLREDLAYFEKTGATQVAAACRNLLRAAGVPVPRRTPGPDIPATLRPMGVTAREMEVLLLVADDLTNREIATRLVLSVRTVDKHVQRLLAKTGTTSRSALGSLLTSPPPASFN